MPHGRVGCEVLHILFDHFGLFWSSFASGTGGPSVRSFFFIDPFLFYSGWSQSMSLVSFHWSRIPTTAAPLLSRPPLLKRYRRLSRFARALLPPLCNPTFTQRILVYFHFSEYIRRFFASAVAVGRWRSYIRKRRECRYATFELSPRGGLRFAERRVLWRELVGGSFFQRYNWN